jgi:hypothetical protein
MKDREEFELPNGTRVRISDRLADIDDDHEDCPFCQGRSAAHRGEPEDSNPFPETEAETGTTEWHESDYGMWLCGHGIGVTEPGGLLWFEQPDRGTKP